MWPDNLDPDMVLREHAVQPVFLEPVGNLFLYFNIYDVVKLRRVCRLWKTLVDEDTAVWSEVHLAGLGATPYKDRVPPLFEYIVKTHGRHMLALHSTGAHLPSVALKYIGEYCYKLQVLSIDEHEACSDDLLLGSQMRIRDRSLRWLNGCENLKCFSANRCAFITDNGAKILAEALPSLEQIELGCSGITDTGAAYLIRKGKELIHINVSTAAITDATLHSISKYCKKLKVLNLHRCKNITDKGLKSVIEECCHLARLIVPHCPKLTDETLLAVAKAWSQNKVMFANLLDIGYNPNVTDRGLEHLVMKCPEHLDHLDISYCSSITHFGVQLVFAKCENLRIFFCDGIRIGPYLHKMGFDHALSVCMFSMQNCGGPLLDGDIHMLGNIVPPFADAIQMRGCRIKGFDHMFWWGFFRNYCCLVNLDLSYCKLTDDSLCVLQHLQMPNLCELLLEGNTSLTDQGLSYVSAGCKTLRKLALQYCDITDQTLENIASRLPLLLILDIRSCVKITDSGITSVVKNCRFLQVIKAGISSSFGALHASSELGCWRSVRDRGILGLENKEDKSSSHRNRQKKKSKRTDEKTKILSQQSMKLGNKAMEALSDHCSQLRNLHLDKNPRISDVGIESLCTGTVVLGLASVSLKQCPEITEAGFQMLIKNCPRLRVLHLTTNRRMTDEAVTRLREYASNITTQHLQITSG